MSPSAMSRHTPFQTAHPIVPTVYFVGTTVLMMFAIHPVYVGLSLAGALALSFRSRGWRATLRGLRWQLPMLALVCLANPLFSASGSTLLGHVGPLAIYGESLAYGACMGALMVSVIVWLECAAQTLTQDKLLAVSGRILPTVSLMVSMTAQLVPQLERRAGTVREVMAACTAAHGADAHGANAHGADQITNPDAEAPDGSESPGKGRWQRRIQRLHPHVRMSNILVSWALEDSLERSDAMRARGWGATDHRTSYQTYRLAGSDLAATVGICLLLALDAFLAWVACSQFRFYPTMPHLVAWWGYLPYAALMALPLL